MKKKRKTDKIIKASLMLGIIAIIFSGTLFFLDTTTSGIKLILFFTPLFVMGALILGIIDFVLVLETPKKKRKLISVLSSILGIISLIMYLTALGAMR